MQRFVKTLMYAGLDREQYRELLPEAKEQNGRFVTTYSSIMAVVFAICLLLSDVADKGLTVNNLIYTAMIAISFVLYLLTRLALPRHPGLSTPLALAFALSLYGYAVAVSLQRPTMQGTAAVAILLVMPALFNYRPLDMIAMTLAEAVAFCAISARIKQHDAAMLDLWNTLFFGGIAVLLSVYQMKVRFRLLMQKRENRRLSETDLLTGVRNRNCFERERQHYAEACA